MPGASSAKRCKFSKALPNELGLRHHRDGLKDIFESALPARFNCEYPVRQEADFRWMQFRR